MNFSPDPVQVFPHPHASCCPSVASFAPAAASLVRHPRRPSCLGGCACRIVAGAVGVCEILFLLLPYQNILNWKTSD